jgi:alpha-glucosidase
VAAPPERIPVLARAGAAVPVQGRDGAVELEVWAPAPGRTGTGLVIADGGDGWERAEPERFTVRGHSGVPVVLREKGGPVGYRVRWRS